jgi:hypothetical protein
MTQNTQHDITLLLDNLKEFLLEKNRRYGDSSASPLNIFSKCTAEDQILSRIDDKLSRIKHSDEMRKNDVVDTIGYLVLLMIQKKWLEFDDLLD